MSASSERRARARACRADEGGIHRREAQELLAQMQLTDIVCASLTIPVILIPASLFPRTLISRALRFGERQLSRDLVQRVLRFG